MTAQELRQRLEAVAATANAIQTQLVIITTQADVLRGQMVALRDVATTLESSPEQAAVERVFSGQGPRRHFMEERTDGSAQAGSQEERLDTSGTVGDTEPGRRRSSRKQ